MIKNVIKNDNYEINIKDNFLHLINYINVLSISGSKIIIEIKDNNLIIFGNNLMISALDEYELIVRGIIKGIEFKNE